MLFNSIDFLLFLPLVVATYFLVPHRFRWFLLLIASYYFYMCWKAEFIILIVLSTLVDYVAALGMEKTASGRMRKMWLGFSLTSNLGMLFTFKYLNFFSTSFQEVFNTFNIGYHFPTYNLLLPAGISFYTFQTLSYTIDVYRGQKKAEHHFGIFALYVCFFPQLVAGPIERAVSFLPQFHEKHALDIQRIVDGLRMVLWGLFKKIVIADRLSIYVNTVYNNPHHFDSAPTFIMATYFFAFQIYCDFSAYSDIAIGSARMLGFDLMENFRKPYESKSISEFWSRWHISLSTWFRDYLYIPLGGNRVGKIYYYRNLFIIFLVSGLWHGANWTFVIWGALHGFFLVFALISKSLRESFSEKIGLKKFKRLHGAVQVFICFHLVCLGWVFFRANNVSDAFHVIGAIFGPNWFSLDISNASHFFYGILGIVSLLAVERLQGNRTMVESFNRWPTWLRWGIYSYCILLILTIGVIDGGQFIYFQF